MAFCTRSYKFKKRLFYTTTTIAMISQLVVMALNLIKLNRKDESELPQTKANEKAYAISIGVVSFVVHLIGLLAALKEHYKTLIGYVILCLLMAGVSIAGAILFYLGNWFPVLMNSLIALRAYSLAKAMKGLQVSYVMDDQTSNNNNTIFVSDHMFPKQIVLSQTFNRGSFVGVKIDNDLNKDHDNNIKDQDTDVDRI